MEPINWKQKYEDQVAITDSLKRDLAALQGRTVLPCPAADKLGEHACDNQHDCWEPCGVMGNDGRFAVRAEPGVGAGVDAALGIRRDPTVRFHDIPIVNDVIPADPDPRGLAVRPARRAEASVDNGHRRRKTD